MEIPKPLDAGTMAAARRLRNVPRYYFHLHNDVDAPDEEGNELPSLEAAILYAVELVRFEAAEAVKVQSHFVAHHRIDIEDEQGLVLESVRFGDVVKIES